MDGGTCPDCGAALLDDDRFVVWCDACDWNVDPDSVERAKSTRERWSDSLSTTLGDRLFEQLRRDPDLRPRWGAARVATYVFAGLVHMFVVGLVALAGLVVVWAWPSFVAIAIGIALLLIAIELRPRVSRLPKHLPVGDRTAAPTLFALFDRVASELGAAPIELVGIDSRFNAGFGKVGWRRVGVVVIGLPLWAVLEPDERVALLGHELAHEVNGDAAHGFIVGTASNALARAHRILTPGAPMRGGPFLMIAVDGLTRLMQRGLRLVIRGVLWVEMRIEYQASQRAEYRADELAAAVASTDASVALLDKLSLTDGCAFAMRLARERDGRADAFGVPRRYVAGLSERERERWRRLDAQRGDRIDETHPPSRRRIQLLLSRPSQPASLGLSPAESAAIDDELREIVRRWTQPSATTDVVLPGMERTARPTGAV